MDDGVTIGVDLGSQEATVFTFNRDGKPQWVTMPSGVRWREGTVYSDAGERMSFLKINSSLALIVVPIYLVGYGAWRLLEWLGWV